MARKSGGNKSLGAAYGLLLAFGYVGAHRFYLSRPISGALQAGLTLAGFILLFGLLGEVYDAALGMLSDGGAWAESAILEGRLSEQQRLAAWGVMACLGGELVWLLGDFLTMSFWNLEEEAE